MFCPATATDEKYRAAMLRVSLARDDARQIGKRRGEKEEKESGKTHINF